MRIEPFVIVGIDPGALAGVVAVKWTARDPVGGRCLVPVIVRAQTVKSEGVLRDPASAGLEIARVASLFIGWHNAVAVGLERPLGPAHRDRIAAYGAQRETIGVIEGRLVTPELQVFSVAPSEAKSALAHDGLASKKGMVSALRMVEGWERCQDLSKERLEAKADAVGIALAAGRKWEARLEALRMANESMSQKVAEGVGTKGPKWNGKWLDRMVEHERKREQRERA